MKSTKKYLFLLGPVLALGLSDLRAEVPGQQVWVGQNGAFEDAANWDPSQPPSGDSYLQFAPVPDLTVTLGADAEVAGIDVQGMPIGDSDPVLVLDLGGHTLSVGISSDETEKRRGIDLQSTAAASTGRRTLHLRNGKVIAAGVTISKFADQAWASLIVGEGAELNSPVSIGTLGRGEMIVRDGGQWISETRNIILGRVEGELAEGIVRILGPNSSWQAKGVTHIPNSKGCVGIGAGGSGLLEVLEGGKMQSFVIQLAAHQKHMQTTPGVGRGQIVVAGEGSSVDCASLYVGGGVESAMDQEALPGGVGTLELKDQGVIKCGRLGVYPFSTLVFRGGHLNQTGVFQETALSAPSVIEPGAILHYVLEKPSDQAPLSVIDLKIEGAKLDIELSEEFQAAVGTIIPIIAASGSIEGTFDELPEGASVSAGGHAFTISYGEGGAGPVSLKRVGAP